MGRFSNKHLMVRSVGALFACLTLAIVAPSVARAGCSSHYVVSRVQSDTDDIGHEYLQVGHASEDAHDTTPRPQPRRLPCSGAFCSGNPVLPYSAPVTRVASIADLWALLTPHFTPERARIASVIASDSALHPIDESGTIFHPPRASLERVV